jgi:hypothetical protein
MNIAPARLPAHGRANWSPSPALDTGTKIRTPLGTFTTDDRATWCTEPNGWTAELRHSKNGRHWFLAVFEAGVYRGRYDNTGWHAATDRKRVRHLRSYQLPLVA